MLIETERLLLRPTTADDLDALAAIHATPELAGFAGSPDRVELADWLRRNDEDWERRGYGRLAIVERGSGAMVGRAGLRYWPQFDEVEAGWMLHPRVWGRGYATESGRASVEWGFETLDIPYITAIIQPGNARSVAVAERLGMSPLRDDTFEGEAVTIHAIHRGGAAGRPSGPAA